MLEFSKVDKDFKIYKDKKVFLFGASGAGERIKKTLTYLRIPIEAFVDNDDTKHGTMFCGINIISFTELKRRIEEDSAYIIQISSSYEMEIAKQLEEAGLVDYILYDEFCNRLEGYTKYRLVKAYPELAQYIFDAKFNNSYSFRARAFIDHIIRQEQQRKDSINIIFSAPKTGSTSLRLSCKEDLAATHTYVFIDKIKNYFDRIITINIIMGVRDVIGQNLSWLFQLAEYSLWNLDEYWKKGGDVQNIFDRYIIKKSNMRASLSEYEYICEKNKTNNLVQDFFDQQIKPFFGIDVYDYPFDTEKGFSVYNFGKVNIMIYQLEKMNSLEKEIGDFLEISDFKLIKANDSEDKWYDSAYQKAKKELKFSKEYFEKCYNGKYMKHFYSENDIEKFKRKWSGNVV